MEFKLDKHELIETIKICQNYLNSYDIEEIEFDINKSLVLPNAIFKLQHQLKHLEDKEIKK